MGLNKCAEVDGCPGILGPFLRWQSFTNLFRLMPQEPLGGALVSADQPPRRIRIRTEPTCLCYQPDWIRIDPEPALQALRLTHVQQYGRFGMIAFIGFDGECPHARRVD